MISIIIPVYNAEKYLTECLNSVLDQSYKDIEVILIDDGSKDCSGKICDEFVKKDKRVVAVHQANSGVSAARNRGLELARGTYVSFVDADDLIDKYLIEKQYYCIQQTHANICIGEHKITINPIKKSSTSGDIKYKVYSRNVALKEILSGRISNLGPVTKLIKKSLLKNLKFAEDISIGEDLLFVVQVLLETEKIVYMPEILYYYRQSIERSTTSVNFVEKSSTLILAYDRVKKILADKMPEILPIVVERQNRINIHVIDIMIKLEIPFENKMFQIFYKDVLANKICILKDPVLSIRTKIGVILLLISEKLYRRIKVSLYKRGKKI